MAKNKLLPSGGQIAWRIASFRMENAVRLVKLSTGAHLWLKSMSNGVKLSIAAHLWLNLSRWGTDLCGFEWCLQTSALVLITSEVHCRFQIYRDLDNILAISASEFTKLNWRIKITTSKLTFRDVVWSMWGASRDRKIVVRSGWN